jgi:hypothetical protein
MHSPFDLDIYVAHLQTERQREAADARLASQLRGPAPRLRSRLAAALRSFANRLDAPPVAVAVPGARPTQAVQS